ncbi:MAG TPA: hypothetical protein DIT13_07030 [Verrucomicrobiales bacterium]|nr:hypothetical protein [Verrucomicrobiales bacterium]
MRIFLFQAVILCALPASAAEPWFETTCLFPVTPANKPNYRIPALIQAPNGDLLVVCEKRNDGPGDIGDHDIVMKRSSDGGKTWTGEILILDDEDRVCTDLTLGFDRGTQKLWLFFLKDKKQFAHLSSTDNGLTWQGPVVIHDQVTKPEWDQLRGKPDTKPFNPKSHAQRWERDWHQRYGCGPGHAMVQLKSGRLLVPARHREDIGGGRLRSFAHCFYSDDHGASWQLGGTIGMHTSECQFIELNDGGIRVISRNESAEDAPDNLRHLTSISKDGGQTWSALRRQEELITPRCHGSLERLDEKTLLFCSPASPFRQKEHPYGRYNLTIRISHDEGASWSAGRAVWPHPGSYSDIAVMTDGSIAVVYERADKGSSHYWDELHFARFNPDWITQ